jgi:AcrR family transcriptional regulator
VLKKLIQAGDEPEVLADLVEREVPSRGSSEEWLEEVYQWIAALRVSFKQEPFPPQFSMPRLIAAFAIVAGKRHIDPEQFYSTLLSKLILDTGAEETGRVPPKLSTKQRILDAALEVFSEKGFHVATVDEIAERAGLGKGTLYRYFANKETLFNELVRLRLEELERSAKAVLDGQDDVLTMIVKYLHTYFEFFDRNQRLYRLIVQERLDIGEQFQDLYVKKIMRRIPLLKRKIYGASQQGVLKKDMDFQTVFYGVMGFVHGVIQKWLASECSYPLVDELPTVREVLFYGFVKSSKAQIQQETD